MYCVLPCTEIIYEFQMSVSANQCLCVVILAVFTRGKEYIINTTGRACYDSVRRHDGYFIGLCESGQRLVKFCQRILFRAFLLFPYSVVAQVLVFCDTLRGCSVSSLMSDRSSVGLHADLHAHIWCLVTLCLGCSVMSGVITAVLRSGSINIGLTYKVENAKI